MPVDNEEDFKLGVPADSKLCIKVISPSSRINATGGIDHPDGTTTDLSHGAIFGRRRCVVLDQKGNHIVRVALIFNVQKKDDEGTVEFTLFDSTGTDLGSFAPVFKGRSVGKNKFVARAKWTIEIV